MLLLLLKIGQDRYALPANRMIEVVPLVSLKKIPQALPGVAGIFNYHGQPVPVIDLSDLTIGMPCQPRVSTRIILVNYPDAAGQKQILGLMAEQASETIQRGKADFFSAGIAVKTAPYLGSVLMDRRGIIQCLEIEKLLSPPLRDLLFAEPVVP
jgi:chemotaxis-related protein WspB